MLDFFPKMPVKPNPECGERHCRKRQLDYQEEMERRKALEVRIDFFFLSCLALRSLFLRLKPEVPEAPVAPEILHEDNEWGISLVDENEADPTADQGPAHLDLVEGVQVSELTQACVFTFTCDFLLSHLKV
jgi:ubiquitin-like modifier-activating enzyme 5